MNEPMNKDAAVIERIELSITPNYTNWSKWECIREFLQNCIDEDARHNPGIIHYDREKSTLNLYNIDATLDRSTLLLGSGTKKGDKTQIGCYGEGYKLAMAGLLEMECDVTIHTGTELWTPRIKYSETFNSNVMVIDVDPTVPQPHRPELFCPSTHKTVIAVTIGGIEDFDMRQTEKNCLNLCKLESIADAYYIRKLHPIVDDEVLYSSDVGSILSNKFARGRLYCKGLYVGSMEELVGGRDWMYGYNLNYIALDRDRKLSSYNDITDAMKRLLIDLEIPMCKLFTFDEYMDDEYPDINILFANRYSDEFKFQMNSYSDMFEKLYPNSFPCDTDSDKQDLASVGMSGVLVTWLQYMQFERVMGKLYDLLLEKRNAYIKVDTSDYKDEIRRAEEKLTKILEVDSFCILPVHFDGPDVDAVRDNDEKSLVLMSAKHDTFKAMIVHSIRAFSNRPYDVLAEVFMDSSFNDMNT